MAECQKVLLRLKQDESKIFVEDNFTDTIWASLNFLQFSCDAGQATMAEFCPQVVTKNVIPKDSNMS